MVREVGRTAHTHATDAAHKAHETSKKVSKGLKALSEKVSGFVEGRITNIMPIYSKQKPANTEVVSNAVQPKLNGHHKPTHGHQQTKAM